MYVLVVVMLHFYAGTGAPAFADERVVMASKMDCESRRDYVLQQWSPVGKPSGPLRDPYVTDAWCFDKATFDKDNHIGQP